jgi:hypothetical protein
MEENMPNSNTARATNDEAEEGAPPSARRPEHTVRVGNVEIAIWKNSKTAGGGEFYTASAPSLRYKNGEEWKDSKSFGPMDLLALQEAAREASAKIRELSKGRSQGR